MGNIGSILGKIVLAYIIVSIIGCFLDDSPVPEEKPLVFEDEGITIHYMLHSGNMMRLTFENTTWEKVEMCSFRIRLMKGYETVFSKQVTIVDLLPKEKRVVEFPFLAAGEYDSIAAEILDYVKTSKGGSYSPAPYGEGGICGASNKMGGQWCYS